MCERKNVCLCVLDSHYRETHTQFFVVCIYRCLCVCVLMMTGWVGWFGWAYRYTPVSHIHTHIYLYIYCIRIHIWHLRAQQSETVKRLTGMYCWLADWLAGCQESWLLHTHRVVHMYAMCGWWSCVSSVCMSSVNQLHCGELQWRHLPAGGGGCTETIRESSGDGYSYRVSMGIMGWKQNWPIDVIYKNSVCWIEASFCVGKWRRTCAKWPHTAHTYITFHWCRPSHTKFAIIPHVHSFHILIQSKAAAIFATPSIKHSQQTQNNHIFLLLFFFIHLLYVHN